MSTSKIGRAINPKKKTNPQYGDKVNQTDQKIDKLQTVLNTFIDGVDEIRSLVKEQNESIGNFFKRINDIEDRLLRLETNTKNESREILRECKDITSKVKECQKSLEKPVEEKSKSSWFSK